MMKELQLDAEDVSEFPLRFLRYSRFHPSLNPCWTKFLVPLNVSICCLVFTLAVKGVMVSHKTDIFFMAECFQSCILMTAGKFILLHMYKQNILNLLQLKTKFWKIKDFEGDIFTECTEISKFVKKILRYYYTVACCTCVFFDLQPFTTGYLPTVCFVPSGWFNFLTVIIWYLSWAFNLTIPGTDGLFCSLGTSLVIQFKLLAYKLKTTKLRELGTEIKMWSQIKKLAFYHNFLLSYCNKLNHTVQAIFMIQFLVSIASASLSVFIFMQPGHWVNRIKFAAYFIYVIIESSFYCVPLEFVGNNSDDVGISLYNSTWYEINSNNVKKSLIFLMARTQKVVKFTAYGLININLQTLIVIFKTTFSFYMYFDSVQKLSDQK